MLTHCLDPKYRESWTPEYFARVKYRLADILSKDDDQMAYVRKLRDEALEIRREHEKFFLPFEISAGKAAETMVLYDHMVPIEGGRSTAGQFKADISGIGDISDALATGRFSRALNVDR